MNLVVHFGLHGPPVLAYSSPLSGLQSWSLGEGTTK